MLALACGASSRVAIPSYVCSALLHAVRYTGAEPVLVDLPESGYNIAPSDVPTSVDVVILPHTFGVAASLGSGSKRPIIEDCAMALGATSGGKALGSHGPIGVFSFYATKMICAGEGGAVTTSDVGLAEAVRDLRDYDGRTDARVRHNYKMTDLQAAIARVQLGKLDAFVARRRELAQTYADRLSDLQIDLPHFGPEDVAYRYVVRVNDDPIRLEHAFDSAGVSARRPVPTPIHRVLGDPDSRYPKTSNAVDRSLSLPLYPDLSSAEADRVTSVARDLLA